MITAQDYAQLRTLMEYRISKTSVDFHRYLYYTINWNNRLIGIKGCRGVGKTTLLLQHIKETFADRSQVLYVSLDNLWFKTHDVAELVQYHYTHGGTYVFFDEIQCYPDWQFLLKNIYDNYPDMYVVYTGSSMLQMHAHEGDLSRRVRSYTLYGMSFREFMQLEGCDIGEAVALEELLTNHTTIATNIFTKVKVLPLFERYLKHGYYPFYQAEADGFGERLQTVIKRVIEEDVPMVEDVDFSTLQKVQKMLVVLAERVPLQPKMAELFRVLDTNRNTGMKMLYLLERASMLALYSSEIRNLKSLIKPDKIYLDNTNLMYALSQHVDEGTLRETFFYNQLKVLHEILLPKQGDFLVDNQYLFEVGGASKTFEQIKDQPNSFLAVDDVEMGVGNRIPLWMFGLLY